MSTPEWIDALVIVRPYAVGRAFVMVGAVKVFDGYRAGTPDALNDPRRDADAFAVRIREQIRHAAVKGRPS